MGTLIGLISSRLISSRPMRFLDGWRSVQGEEEAEERSVRESESGEERRVTVQYSTSISWANNKRVIMLPSHVDKLQQ